MPAFVDPPGLVDQEVVADVSPALSDRVVVVDGPDRRRRVGVVVLGGGVVDDQLLHRIERRRPGLLPGRVEAQPLVGSPAGAQDDRRLGDARRRGHRRGPGRVALAQGQQRDAADRSGDEHPHGARPARQRHGPVDLAAPSALGQLVQEHRAHAAEAPPVAAQAEDDPRARAPAPVQREVRRARRQDEGMGAKDGGRVLASRRGGGGPSAGRRRDGQQGAEREEGERGATHHAEPIRTGRQRLAIWKPARSKAGPSCSSAKSSSGANTPPRDGSRARSWTSASPSTTVDCAVMR